MFSACGLLALVPESHGQSYTNLVFNDPTPERIAGTELMEDAVYLFEDVATGVDAEVKILSFQNGASLARIDDHLEASPTDLFYPQLSGNPSLNPRVMFEVTLVDASLGTPTPLDFRWTLADLDSSSGTNGSIFEVGVLTEIGNYTLEGDPADPSNLTHTTDGPGVHLFSSNPIIENFTGVNLNDTVVMVLAEYTNTSVFQFGFGFEGTQTSNTRNVAASGLPTVIDNFSVPVTTGVPEPDVWAYGLLAGLLSWRRRRS